MGISGAVTSMEERFRRVTERCVSLFLTVVARSMFQALLCHDVGRGTGEGSSTVSRGHFAGPHAVVMVC